MSSRKPEPKIWSAWDDWIWSQTQSRYYSQRQDTQGEIETRWGPQYASGDYSEDIETYDNGGDAGYSYISYPTAGEIATMWGPQHASGDYSEDNGNYDNGGDAGYSPGISSPFARRTSEQLGQDERLSGGFHDPASMFRGRDNDRSPSKGHRGSQFHGSGYDGRTQGQNGAFVPPEGDSDEYPVSSPRGYKIASRGVDERDVGAPRHYPPCGHSIMSGDNHEQDVKAPRDSHGNYESEDEEQDISPQDSKKVPRRKGKAPAQHRPPPYKQGHPGSYSQQDTNVYYRGDDGKFYKGVGKGSRRDKNVYYRGDDGKLHKGVGKNRGNQGKGGQNDRDAKIGR